MYSLTSLKHGRFQTPQQKQRLIHEIAESKGKQELFATKSPEVLKRLTDAAIIESVRASTAIEGVVVPEAKRLRAMLSDARYKAKSRDEQDVLAYKNGLSFIFEVASGQELSLELIVTLSHILWAHEPSLAGLKTEDNKIALSYPDGSKVIRFHPPSAEDTPELLRQTCKLYNELIAGREWVDHQVVAACILDMLCIHPVVDGNGRLARLLHTHLLNQCGYDVVRYISLEGLVESDKKTYYESLYESSQGWHEANHPLNPWMNFSLGKLNLAYKRFERQVAVAEEVYADFARSSEAAKVEHVLEIVAVGQLFDRAFIESQSGASGRTTRRVIEKWLAAGRLRAEGEGRARHYRKLPVLLA